MFWGIEFDFEGPGAASANLKDKQFAMLVQARAFDKGLIVMGMIGSGNLEATKGGHIILSPAYNITKEEIERVVDIFVESVEELLKEATL